MRRLLATLGFSYLEVVEEQPEVLHQKHYLQLQRQMQQEPGQVHIDSQNHIPHPLLTG